MIVLGPTHGHDRPTYYLDSVRARSVDDLLIGLNHSKHQCIVLGLRNLTFARESAQVIHSFENDEITNFMARDDIAIEAS